MIKTFIYSIHFVESLTFNECVALDVLREAQCCPPGHSTGHRLQKVMDVLIVDLTERNPNGILDVRLHLQDDFILCGRPLCSRKGRVRNQALKI